MNIKEFLVLKACDVLPTDLKYYILDIIRQEAARTIQMLYTFRVSKNVDIFIKFMYISNNLNSYQWHYVNIFIEYAVKNITYTYIQEPGTWIDYLEDIRYNYQQFRYFHVNNVNCIMNNIKNANVIYRNTGIEYWNNF
jgi:hypothetical protein